MYGRYVLWRRGEVQWRCSIRGKLGVVCIGGYVKGIVMVEIIYGFWRISILLFVQSLCVMTIMVLLFGLVCCAIVGHLMTFGMRSMLICGCNHGQTIVC